MWDLLLAPINWLEAHPAVLAWLVGWAGAISAGQIVKYQAPLRWEARSIERLVQAATVATGTAVSWATWPNVAANRFTFALVVGMSAPLAYTWAMALVRWKFPALAERATVQGVIEKRLAKLPVEPPRDAV